MTDDEDDERAIEHISRALPELVAGPAGGLIGYALGGAAGAVAGGLVTPAMLTAWNLGGVALIRRLSRGSRALDIAADELDVGLDILTERATTDDNRLELLARVLEAAGRTPLEAKIHALGRVLAEGLAPGSNVDEPLILAAALNDIEAPHVQVMQALQVADQTVDGDVPGWRDDEFLHVLPGAAAVIGPILNALEQHDLVRTSSATWPSGHGFLRPGPYVLTRLGSQVLELLRAPTS